jgi:hypothetical protein
LPAAQAGTVPGGPGGQANSQLPQFLGSFWMSTQPEGQTTWPLEQWPPELPVDEPLELPLDDVLVAPPPDPPVPPPPDQVPLAALHAVDSVSAVPA